MTRKTVAEGGQTDGATDLSPKPNEKEGAIVAEPSKKSNNPADGVELEAQEEDNTSEPPVESDGRLRSDAAARGDSVNSEENLDPGIERGKSACPEDPQPKPSTNTGTNPSNMKTTTTPAPDEDPNSDPENAAAKNKIEEITAAAEGGQTDGAAESLPEPKVVSEAASTASLMNDNPAEKHELIDHGEYNTSEPPVDSNGRLRPDSAAGGYSVNPEKKLDPRIGRGNPAAPGDPQPTSKPKPSNMKMITTPAPDEDPNNDPGNAPTKSKIEEITAEEMMTKHAGEVPKAEKKFSLASLKSKSEDAVSRSNTRPGTITVDKPKDDTYVRTSTNPEERAVFDFIELKTEEKLYLLTPDFVEEINALNEDRAQLIIKPVKKRLIYSVTRLGVPFLWPITIMKGNTWVDSANTCADVAKESWIRVVSNMSARHYDYVTSPSTNEPKWPSMTYEDAVLKGFDGKIIDTMDHDVIRHLLGEG